jgi:hypothetical protein
MPKECGAGSLAVANVTWFSTLSKSPTHPEMPFPQGDGEGSRLPVDMCGALVRKSLVDSHLPAFLYCALVGNEALAGTLLLLLGQAFLLR